MKKSSHLITVANETSKYIPFIENGGYGYSEPKKKEELKRLRDSVTFSTIKAIKIADLILKEINTYIDTIKNNKKAYWFSSLFNRVAEMKRKLDDQIFDAKSLKDKYGNKKIDFKSIVLEDDEYAINGWDIFRMGTNVNDFYPTYFGHLTEKYGKADKSNMEIIHNEYIQRCTSHLTEKYGKADKSNMEIIHNEYIQRCTSFDLNRKLRKGESLNKNENKIYNAINNSCSNNKLKENIILFRYVSQEFINKYNIEFNRLSQSSISNAIFKFKKNVIDKEIKEKENGFISSSCDLKENVFKSRDVLLALYVEKGCHLYVTNNEKETEIILPQGMIYHFFDCFFIEVILLDEKCFQMVIKTFIKNNY